MNYRFEKITFFPRKNFRQDLTYNSRGALHTLYAMLLSNLKWEDAIDLLSFSFRHQLGVKVVRVT